MIQNVVNLALLGPIQSKNYLLSPLSTALRISFNFKL
jgi:hypothetical protein